MNRVKARGHCGFNIKPSLLHEMIKHKKPLCRRDLYPNTCSIRFRKHLHSRHRRGEVSVKIYRLHELNFATLITGKSAVRGYAPTGERGRGTGGCCAVREVSEQGDSGHCNPNVAHEIINGGIPCQ